MKKERIESQNESEEAETSDNYKHKFFLRDTNVFNCSICGLKLIFPDVYQCEREIHIACSSCYFESPNRCKECLIFPSGYKCCRLMEQILESLEESCVNQKHGCEETVQFILSDVHLKYHCKFVPCSCPFEGCSFVGPSKKLSQHLSTSHPDSVTSFLYNSSFSVSLESETLRVLQETVDGNLFVLRNEAKDDLVGNVVSISRIWPLYRMTSLSIDLEVRDGEFKRSIKLTYKMESIDCYLAHRRPSTCSEFLPVPREFSVRGKLELHVRISLG